MRVKRWKRSTEGTIFQRTLLSRRLRVFLALGAPALDICGVDEDTGYESEDVLPLGAMMLAEPDDKGRGPSQSNLFSTASAGEASGGNFCQPSTSQKSRFSSERSSSGNAGIARTQDAARQIFRAEETGVR